MNYEPGELDQFIDFEREVLTPDGIGGHTVTLNTLDYCVPAKIRALSGKETARYDQLSASQLVMFVTRYRDDVRADDRIIWDGKSYNIKAIPPVTSRALYSEFIAESGVAL